MTGPSTKQWEMQLLVMQQCLGITWALVQRREPKVGEIEAMTNRQEDRIRTATGNRRGSRFLDWSDAKLIMEGTLRACLEALEKGEGP